MYESSGAGAKAEAQCVYSYEYTIGYAEAQCVYSYEYAEALQLWLKRNACIHMNTLKRNACIHMNTLKRNACIHMNTLKRNALKRNIHMNASCAMRNHCLLLKETYEKQEMYLEVQCVYSYECVMSFGDKD